MRSTPRISADRSQLGQPGGARGRRRAGVAGSPYAAASPTSPAVATTSTTRCPSAAALAIEPGGEHRLVVGVGVERHQRVRHGADLGTRPGAGAPAPRAAAPVYAFGRRGATVSAVRGRPPPEASWR